MVKIRLRRVGAKKQPSYRVVVADSRAPRDGRFLETIGHYDPRSDPPRVVIFEDRALHWLSVGAQPSEPVARFFEKLGLPGKLKQVHAGAKIAEVAAPRPQAPAKPAVEAEAPPKAARRGAKKEAEAETVAEAEPAPVEEVASEVVAEAAPPEAGAAEVDAAPEAEAPAAAEPGPAAAAMPIADLGLSARVAKALEAEGITTAGQLAAKLSQGDEELLAISGIGAKAVEEIAARLSVHGLGASA
jgi:small subunit ribosomal protein S16